MSKFYCFSFKETIIHTVTIEADSEEAARYKFDNEDYEVSTESYNVDKSIIEFSEIG
jgi:hypothetical protein